MLTAGPQPQAPAGAEQEERQSDDGRVHEVHEDRLVEQDRSDDRDLRQAGDLDVGQRELVGIQAPRSFLHDRAVEERRQAQGQDVQDDADDDLIHPELDGEEGKEGSQEGTRKGRRDEARVGGLEVRGRHDTRERADQEVALDRDIDDAHALRDDAREGAEDQRSRDSHGGHQGRGQGDDARGPRARVEQESQDRGQPDESHAADARPRGLGDAPQRRHERPRGDGDRQGREHPHDGRTRGDNVGDRVGLRLVVQTQGHVASSSGREDHEQHAGGHVDAGKFPGALGLNLRDHAGLTCAHQTSPFAPARHVDAGQPERPPQEHPEQQSAGRSPTAG